MKKLIKKYIPKMLRKKCRYVVDFYKRTNNNPSKVKLLLLLLVNYFKFNFYKNETALLKKADVYLNDTFVYGINYYKTIISDKNIIDNNSIDYSKVLDYSLDNFRKMTSNEECIIFIDEIDKYIDRICKALTNSKMKNRKLLIEYFENIKNKKCQHYDEALQRILFYNPFNL